MSRKKSMRVLLSATLIPLSLALAGSTTWAADAKTYPGSMCVRWSGSSPSYNTSAIGNPSSTQWTYLDCPVINDDMGADTQSSVVRVLDRHYSSDVRCSINSAYWNNTNDQFYGWWGSNISSSGSGNDLQVLNTGGIGGSGSTVHTYFSCRIPPTYNGNRSYTISYYANEG